MGELCSDKASSRIDDVSFLIKNAVSMIARPAESTKSWADPRGNPNWLEQDRGASEMTKRSTTKKKQWAGHEGSSTNDLPTSHSVSLNERSQIVSRITSVSLTKLPRYCDAVRSCPACLSRNAAPVGAKSGFELARCVACRTLFTAELPANSDPRFYEEVYEDSGLDDLPDIVRIRTAEIVETFNPWRGNGRLLDVGCGVGHVLQAAVTAGWQPEGVEVAESAVRQLTSRGFTVRRGFLNELEYSSDLFDVVVANGVIEHVRDVDAFVAECVRVLKPEGLFYVTTPNGVACSARLLGIRWSVVDPPDHLQLFTARGIRSLFDRHSLTIRKRLTEGFNPLEVIARVRRANDDFNRVASAYALNAAFSASRSRRIVKTAINVALSATQLGDEMKLYSTK